MKHKVKIRVPVEKRGLFGARKTVYEMRVIEVDDKTYKEMQRKKKAQPFSVEEMMLYDEVFDEWDE